MVEGDPHKKYIKFLQDGGRVLRIDKSNDKYQILTADDIELDSQRQPWLKYGFNDLIMLKEDKVSAIDMLALIFKQQQRITVFRLKDIIKCISKKHSTDIRPLKLHLNNKDDIFDIEQEPTLQFNILTEDFSGDQCELDANIFLDDDYWIMNLYPKLHLIGPYKNDTIYDEVHKAMTEELSDYGMLCFTVTIDDVTEFIKSKNK